MIVPVGFMPEADGSIIKDLNVRCPLCSSLTNFNVIFSAGEIHEVARDVMERLSKFPDSASFIKAALRELGKIRSGKELATARSNGSLAILKRHGLMPKTKKDLAIIVGVLWAIAKWLSSHPDKKVEDLTPTMVVNIYNQTGDVHERH
jgi:hypothetical protein